MVKRWKYLYFVYCLFGKFEEGVDCDWVVFVFEGIVIFFVGFVMVIFRVELINGMEVVLAWFFEFISKWISNFELIWFIRGDVNLICF